MRQLDFINSLIEKENTIESKMYDLLTKNMKYNDDIAKTIIATIYDNTNQDYNFDMYFDYNDEVDEKTIAEFINKHKCEYDTLEDAKCDLRCFIEEKFDIRDSECEYRHELAKELDRIEIDLPDWIELVDKDWTINTLWDVRCYVDWNEVVDKMYDELWILEVRYDVLKICRWCYRIAISSTKCHDLFTTCFFDWKYKDEDRLVDWEWKTLPSYWKEDIQSTKDEYLIQKLCKANKFDIEDIYKYQMCEDWSKTEQKYTEFRDKNKFFDNLYIELVNCMWYWEDLRFLTNMNIDELLTYSCVKNQKFDLYNTSHFGFYDYVNWTWSMFDWVIDFHYEVDTKDLDVMLFSNVHYFEETYWFTNRAFWL